MEMTVWRSSPVRITSIYLVHCTEQALDATNVLVSNLNCTGSQYVLSFMPLVPS